jgi:hypothetical protein
MEPKMGYFFQKTKGKLSSGSDAGRDLYCLALQARPDPVTADAIAFPVEPTP